MKVLIIGRTRFIGTRAVRRIYNVDHVDAGRFNYAAEDAAIEKLEPRS